MGRFGIDLSNSKKRVKGKSLSKNEYLSLTPDEQRRARSRGLK